MSRLTTAFAALVTAIALLPALPATAVGERLVIDFEGIAEGTIVSSVSVEKGVAGPSVAGAITVAGWREGDRTTQRAMVFDGTCAPWNHRLGCSGQDTDLFFPARGNILIVSEDLDVNDPDDDLNGAFEFDFSALGPVTVESVGILDTNSQTTEMHFTKTDGTTETRRVSGTGDGQSTDAAAGVSSVRSMVVDLNGAGAVDDIVITIEAAAPPSTTSTTTTSAPTTTTTTTTSVPGSPATTTTTTTTAPATTAAATSGELAVRVFVDGLDASSAPGPERPAGDTGIATYEVTNTTGSTVWALYLWQEGVGGVTCSDRTLSAGETVMCEVGLTFGTGPFSEAVEATAWPENGSISGSATLHYDGTSAPTDDDGFVNVALGKPATQADTNNWDVGTPPRLAVDGNRDGDHDGASVAMTYRVSDAWWEVDLGAVHDIDHIALWNRTDCCADRLRDFYVFVSDAAFEVKDIKNTLTQEGVTAIHHADPVGRRIDIPVDRTGRFVRIQLAYDDAVLQLAEVEVMVSDTAPVVPAGPPTLSMRVIPSATEVAPGDEVGFTYEISNTSSVDLWAAYVWHEGVGAGDCPDRALEPGETIQCTGSVLAEAGRHLDPVSAQAWDGDGVEASASASIEYTATADGAVDGPAIELALLLAGSPATIPGPQVGFGDSLEWTYEITNVGTEELWALYLRHDSVGPIDCPTRNLVPGQTVTCSRTASAAAGTHEDQVAASAWDAAGRRATDLGTAAYRSDVSADSQSIEIEAGVAGDPADSPPGPVVAAGSTIPLTFDVVNTGGTDLWALWVNVPGFGRATCPQRELRAGDTVRCTLAISASAGLHTATARAVAYDSAGGEIEASDPVHVFVPASSGAAIHLDLLVDGLNGDQAAGPRIAAGETMTFTYLVSNEGSVPLTDVAVFDSAHGAISCPRNSIQPGETLVCTLRETATLRLTHIDATVTARDGSRVVNDTERLYYHVKPYGREDELLLEVTIAGADADTAPGPALEVGRSVQVRYVLTNNSREATMWSAEVLDPKVPANRMSCFGGPTLGHYQSMVCTATVTVEAGDWSNLVVGHAWSNNGPRLDASDRLHYRGIL